MAALSPWTGSDEQLADLGRVIANADDVRLDQLGATASAMVEQRAPNAPQAAKDEAVRRLSGWFAEAPARLESRRSVQAGSVGIRQTYHHAADPMRSSGAAALLASFVEERAYPIGGDDA